MLFMCTPCMGLSANPSSTGGLWKAQVAFLDLRLADIPAGAGLVSTGPVACLSGQLQLIKGQLECHPRYASRGIPLYRAVTAACKRTHAGSPQRQPQRCDAGCVQAACAPERAVHAVQFGGGWVCASGAAPGASCRPACHAPARSCGNAGASLSPGMLPTQGPGCKKGACARLCLSMSRPHPYLCSVMLWRMAGTL